MYLQTTLINVELFMMHFCWQYINTNDHNHIYCINIMLWNTNLWEQIETDETMILINFVRLWVTEQQLCVSQQLTLPVSDCGVFVIAILCLSVLESLDHWSHSTMLDCLSLISWRKRITTRVTSSLSSTVEPLYSGHHRGMKFREVALSQGWIKY